MPFLHDSAVGGDLRIVNAAAAIPASFGALAAGADDPFGSPAFLRALEESGAASAQTGWHPVHLLLEDARGARALAFAWLKDHSWGESVFDHAWADALERAGGRCYPKLQLCVPFTPVPGRRLFARDDAARADLAASIEELVDRTGLSSAHVTSATPDEVRLLEGRGWLRRTGLRFVWRSRGERDFADVLSALKSRRRKQIRREREAVAKAGVEIRELAGADLAPEHMEAFHRLYPATVDRRFGAPWLHLRTFRLLREAPGERLLLIAAFSKARMVAAALYVRGRDVLWGRLWGAAHDAPELLDFELCCYRGIELCPREGIPAMDAGIQGARSKVPRGFAPEIHESAHLIRHPGLREAVARFLARERRQEEEARSGLLAALPYAERGSCAGPPSSATTTPEATSRSISDSP